jgi:Fe-S cluster biogenesis protein NfuA
LFCALKDFGDTCTGCVISSVTLLKTLVGVLYEVVESSSCVHSIPLVILHLIGIVTSPQK